MKDRNRRLLWRTVALAGMLATLRSSNAGAAGQGSGPAVTLSPQVLNFPSQVATTTSAPQPVTLTNVGTQALTISSIVLDGSFSQTNTCPTSGTLAAGASCTFMVSFMAPNGGPAVQPGFIEIKDNAPPGLQVISLGGTVADFSLAASPTSASVSPGASAMYKITATASGGFNQAVSLSCGALPTGASCSFSPSSVTPGTNPATTTLTVRTTAGSFLAPYMPPNGPGSQVSLWLTALALAGVAGLFTSRRRARGGRSLFFCASAILVLVFGMEACGGGGSSSNGGGAVATPAGTYSVLVTGSPTGGPTTLNNPVVLTLVVN